MTDWTRVPMVEVIARMEALEAALRDEEGNVIQLLLFLTETAATLRHRGDTDVAAIIEDVLHKYIALTGPGEDA